MELVSFSTVLQCWSFLLHWLLAMVWYILLPYILHIWRFMVLLLTPWTPLEYFQVSNLWFSNPNYPYIQASFVSSFKTDGRYIELCFFLPNKTTKRLCLSSIFRVCPLKTAIMTIKSFPWANTMRTDRHRRRSIDRHCVAWRYLLCSSVGHTASIVYYIRASLKSDRRILKYKWCWWSTVRLFLVNFLNTSVWLTISISLWSLK